MADEESCFLTEEEAYSKAIGYAQSIGLRGQPTAYSIRQMTLSEHGEAIGMVSEAAQADTVVWVFACAGTVGRTLPDGSPASYMAFAVDAITGVPINPSAHHPGETPVKERPFPVY